MTNETQETYIYRERERELNAKSSYTIRTTTDVHKHPTTDFRPFFLGPMQQLRSSQVIWMGQYLQPHHFFKLMDLFEKIGRSTSFCDFL